MLWYYCLVKEHSPDAAIKHGQTLFYAMREWMNEWMNETFILFSQKLL